MSSRRHVLQEIIAMRGKIAGLFMAAVICTSALLVPLMSTDAEASDCSGPVKDTAADYQKYFIEHLTDSVSPEDYGGLTDEELTAVYLASYQEFVSSRHDSMFDFADIYISNLARCVDGSENFGGFSESCLTVSSEQTRNGVDRVVSYPYGYDIYLSTETMNLISTHGGGITGIVAALAGLAAPYSVILAVAVYLLPIVSSWAYPDGVVIEYRTGYPVNIFGMTIVIPYPTPLITAHGQ